MKEPLTNAPTIEEVFRTIYQGLYDQGKPSIEGDSCLYRCGNLKCAAGMVIPDQLYNPSMEGESVYGLSALFRDTLKMSQDTVMLMAAFQSIHDGPLSRKEARGDKRHFREELNWHAAKLAKRFDIPFTALS